MIDLSKTYKTRDGREVKLYTIDKSIGKKCVIGVYKHFDDWYSGRWNINGKWGVNKVYTHLDLVEVKEKITGYMNIYRVDGFTGYYTSGRVHRSLSAAKLLATTDTVARVKIEFEEGQFDE